MTPRTFALAVVASSLLVACVPVQQAERLVLPEEVWHGTGSLKVARDSPHVVTLADGRVLVLGGLEEVPAPVEAYNPAKGDWTTWGATFQRTEVPVLLLDGRVLLTDERQPKLLDPATHDISNAGRFITPRTAHTATRLPDGRVLVVGGSVGDGDGAAPTALCELYDPVANAWTQVASLAQPRENHAAALLEDGQVLIVGGETVLVSGGLVLTQTVERYDPKADHWTTLPGSRFPHADAFAASLSDGTVLVLGGQSDDALFSAERFTPATNTWTAVTAPAPTLDADDGCVLNDGRVLIVAGDATFRFEDGTGTWTALGNVSQKDRTESALAALNDDGALLVGGLQRVEVKAPDIEVQLPDGGVSSGGGSGGSGSTTGSGSGSSGSGSSGSHVTTGGSSHVSHHNGHHHHHF